MTDRLDPLDPHDELARRLGELPTEVAPERDLFPAIRARIGESAAATASPLAPSSALSSAPRPLRLRWLAVAAALLVALGAGWLLRARVEPTSIVVEVPAEPPPVAAPSVARTAYAATGRELDQIRDELRRAIDAQSSALPPATRRLVFDNLATIERAIGEIEGALAAAPADPELARTYVVYRQREIDLLRQANQLASRL